MGAQETVLCPGNGKDVARVAAMARDYIEQGLGWTWTQPRINRTMRKGNGVFVVARCGAQVVGFGLMAMADQAAHLLLLAVDPAHRGRGIGRQMIQWLEKSARHAGLRDVLLEVRAANNEGRAFYRRLGYKETNIIEGYYQGREAAIRMTHQLYREDHRRSIGLRQAVEDLLDSLPDEA